MRNSAPTTYLGDPAASQMQRLGGDGSNSSSPGLRQPRASSRAEMLIPATRRRQRLNAPLPTARETSSTPRVVASSALGALRIAAAQPLMFYTAL
ncbi:hypothetical protein ASPZODRAFT_17232 [Penicilliopsis zonata CBS 506.65]|uniref:Uncharacterized protein n=1 Tax=Penicilliopsis zonata CBS 506.65 TaxID=1073090 RepID=A0A1L9SF00_9EURO|nr:hypothetical protein ASPZODRAFT_17232 [Penicilliopsis zonata CBS 506.65]OJJ45790.1 hypothetical protein ASPZODRAFT_17232 [Penicilliopsis zonata CBS 506.65]